MVPSRPLRVLHITTYDQGGAGVACLRLHRALRDLQVDSRVLINRPSTSGEGIIGTGTRWTAALRYRIDRLPLKLYPRKGFFASWSINWVPVPRDLKFGDWEPDIVHAHWIADGFLRVRALAEARKPVVWTMHDMWPFTGGCHYTRDCSKYRDGCGSCPQLGSQKLHDLSFRSASRKAQAWKATRGVAVSPGLWLAEEARASAIFSGTRVEVIPNGLDGNRFNVGDRCAARRQLQLQKDDQVLLAGAVGAVIDERKGFALLAEAMRKCVSLGGTDKWRLLVFGAAEGPGKEQLGIPVTYCGAIKDESQLPMIYRAADVYVLPSLQDNLPNTVVEAMACGTPTVAFRCSGLATMIQEGITGHLAEPFSSDSLASVIQAAMNSTPDEMRGRCREHFEKIYAWPGPAQQYLNLYAELLQ